MTDEERMDAIVRAAGELAACAANVKLGYFLPESLESAWQRLLALRWNYNMAEAEVQGYEQEPPRLVLLADGKIAIAIYTVGNDREYNWFVGSTCIVPTAWMPLPPQGSSPSEF